MRRIRVVQQGTDLTATGGLTSELKSLSNSSLNEKYEMIPMILPKMHRMVNWPDFIFYYRFLKRTKPDIVQIRGAQIDGLNAQLAARLVPGVKILLCVHGMFSELVYMNPIKKYIHTNIIEPIIFHMCDGISCVYRKGEERKQIVKYRKKLLPFVYNRMPEHIILTTEQKKTIRRHYGIPEEAVVGVFCGRITIEKGLSYLLKAFVEMKDRWPDLFHALIVGDGAYLDEFKSGINENGLSDYVHCIGALKDVKPVLGASDFFIMPSLHENHSIALLEALAADLPCIATDVGGNGEIIHDGIEGMLCKPFSSSELESCIYKIVMDKDRRIQYSKNIMGNEYYLFSNEAVDRQLDNVYQILLRK